MDSVTPIRVKFLDLWTNIVLTFPKLFEPLSESEVQAREEFFQIISLEFPRDSSVLKSGSELECMGAFGLDKDNVNHQHLYFFWTYLSMKVYPELRNTYLRSGRNDNIFGFALGFPISETKIVILGEDPSDDRRVQSLGFAFHLSPCPSTTALLGYLKQEMELADRIFTEYYCLPSTTEKPFTAGLQLENRKRDANLQAWIDQRVLLVNTMLTYKDEAWIHFTKFLMQYLAKHGDPKVFILMGNPAKKMKTVIEKVEGEGRQKVVTVEHPNAEGWRAQGNVDPNWTAVNIFKKKLPFLNAAYHKFVQTKEVMDWLAIADETVEARDERHARLLALFETIETPGVANTGNSDLKKAVDIIKG